MLRPEPSEREGLRPYTCGAMRHNDHIILPYAVSDTFSNFATIKISALMQAMKVDSRLSSANSSIESQGA